jgi:hypothetical protein
MTTKNTIITAVIDSVLYIPIEAVFSNDSMSYVLKKNGSGMIRQQVIVGQSNENEIIISSGLKEEDEVFLNQPEKIEDIDLALLTKEEIEKFKPKPGLQKQNKLEKSDSMAPHRMNRTQFPPRGKQKSN